MKAQRWLVENCKLASHWLKNSCSIVQHWDNICSCVKLCSISRSVLYFWRFVIFDFEQQKIPRHSGLDKKLLYSSCAQCTVEEFSRGFEFSRDFSLFLNLGRFWTIFRNVKFLLKTRFHQVCQVFLFSFEYSRIFNICSYQWCR